MPLSACRIDADRYLELAEQGVSEGERGELINGTIVPMSPAGPERHEYPGRLVDAAYACSARAPFV